MAKERLVVAPGSRIAAEGGIEAMRRMDLGGLSAAEAYRIWGSRFYPTTPSRKTPMPGSILVPRDELSGVLRKVLARLDDVGRRGLAGIGRPGSREELLLAFDDGEGNLRALGPSERRVLLAIAREQGGGEYRAPFRGDQEPRPERGEPAKPKARTKTAVQRG